MLLVLESSEIGGYEVEDGGGLGVPARECGPVNGIGHRK